MFLNYDDITREFTDVFEVTDLKEGDNAGLHRLVQSNYVIP
jgi:hypothetical protein